MKEPLPADCSGFSEGRLFLTQGGCLHHRLLPRPSGPFPEPVSLGDDESIQPEQIEISGILHEAGIPPHEIIPLTLLRFFGVNHQKVAVLMPMGYQFQEKPTMPSLLSTSDKRHSSI